MELSGHNYNNDTFNSLLDGLNGDVILNKRASNNEAVKISGSDVFSSTTQDTMNSILDEDRQAIAAELQFAADRSKTPLTQEDFVNFITASHSEGLKGKKLEKAAQKFCNNLNRAISDPVGDTRLSGSLNSSSHNVIPANYNPDFVGEGKKCGYLGMSKNPNSIWDSEALQRLASKPTDRIDQNGDERIASDKKAKEEFAKFQKDEFWNNVHTKAASCDSMSSKVANVSTGQEVGTSQALPNSSMSMFNSDRDFSNIPAKTAGENLKDQAKERHEKVANSKEEWSKTSAAKKANDSSLIFDEQPSEPTSTRHNVTRESVDKMFEGLANILKQ